MNLRLSLPRFAAVPAAAAAALLLAACGGGSGTAETPSSAAPSVSVDRQAAAYCASVSCYTLPVIINNNLPYGVLIKDVFGVDNNDWANSRRPDHAPPEGLEGQYMNPGTQVTRDFDTNKSNTVVPFGLVIVDGSNHGRQLAHVEFDIHGNVGSQCGWTFRNLAGSDLDLCGTTVTRTTPEGLTITITSGRINQWAPTTIELS